MDSVELVKREMRRRNYSHKTIKAYVYCIRNFLKKYPHSVRRISKADVRHYLESLNGKSGSTKNLHLSALVFLMKNVLNKNFTSKISYSRTPKKLPVILSRKEAGLLFKKIQNRKHRLIVKLLYGSGMRVSEIVKLRIRDLDLQNNYGWVREGKGRKDRMFIIPGMLKAGIEEVIKEKAKDYDSYLFDSCKGHLSVRSVQEIIKKAAKKAGIMKSVHPHTLRHSYATHLIENGYDISAVQSLLGHNSPRTTMIYLHTAMPTLLKVRSPLDDLPAAPTTTSPQPRNGNRKEDYEHPKTSKKHP